MGIRFLLRRWLFSVTRHNVIFVIVVLASSGCALNQTVVRIDYSPAVATTRVIPSTSAQKQIGRIEVRDNRIDGFLKKKPEDPRFLIHKKNGYFQDTYGEYVLNKPIGDYIRQSMLHILPMAGVSISDSSSLAIQADILDIRHILIPGIFSAVRNDVAIRVRINLVDTATSTSLWRSEFVSVSPIIRSSLISIGDDIARAFFSAVDDLALDIANSINLHNLQPSLQANHMLNNKDVHQSAHFSSYKSDF